MLRDRFLKYASHIQRFSSFSNLRKKLVLAKEWYLHFTCKSQQTLDHVKLYFLKRFLGQGLVIHLFTYILLIPHPISERAVLNYQDRRNPWRVSYVPAFSHGFHGQDQNEQHAVHRTLSISSSEWEEVQEFFLLRISKFWFFAKQ